MEIKNPGWRKMVQQTKITQRGIEINEYVPLYIPRRMADDISDSYCCKVRLRPNRSRMTMTNAQPLMTSTRLLRTLKEIIITFLCMLGALTLISNIAVVQGKPLRAILTQVVSAEVICIIKHQPLGMPTIAIVMKRLVLRFAQPGCSLRS